MKEQELRELDAWIAERVMGWERAVVYGNGNGEWHLNGKKVCLFDTAPSFSKDPAAAMMVLEKCIFKRNLKISCDASEWHIDDELPETEIQNFETSSASATKLPLAMCLFAKRLFTK